MALVESAGLFMRHALLLAPPQHKAPATWTRGGRGNSHPQETRDMIHSNGSNGKQTTDDKARALVAADRAPF